MSAAHGPIGQLWHDEFMSAAADVADSPDGGCTIAMGVLFAAVADPTWAEAWANAIGAELSERKGLTETVAKVAGVARRIHTTLPPPGAGS